MYKQHTLHVMAYFDFFNRMYLQIRYQCKAQSFMIFSLLNFQRFSNASKIICKPNLLQFYRVSQEQSLKTGSLNNYVFVKISVKYYDDHSF